MAKKQIIYNRGDRIGLTCDCGRFVDGLTPDIKAVKCWVCVAREAAPPVQRKPKTTEVRPKGWQRRKHYESPSGTIYSFGKEVTADERTDTISPTDVGKSSKKVGAKTDKAGEKQETTNRRKSSNKEIRRKTPGRKTRG